MVFLFRSGTELICDRLKQQKVIDSIKGCCITQKSQGKSLFVYIKGYCYFTTLTLRMKRLFPVLCLVFLFSGCKKSIENAKQDLVIKAMTDGQWSVTSFTQNGTDITADFTGYKFQYYGNKTVDAIK